MFYNTKVESFWISTNRKRRKNMFYNTFLDAYQKVTSSNKKYGRKNKETVT
ncbi:hypothetical protein EV202_12157 [Bacteroides heparinolyticus]|uniref:Uncharacterized protein n=1 Tax=Prevotella heparinolytica TaxID=28113 RepID=A0A4R2LHA7_9BACE|nr:hypothetical protein EV202_12157 [Bacteroides heparinolyticus]